MKILKGIYGDIMTSPVYETESMGFDGPNFYNLVSCFETDQSVYELKNTLNEIENDHGRHANETKFSSRTLDIDILYYDELVDVQKNIPRSEIVKFDFVLRPLHDLCPAHIHPITQKTHHTMINDTAYEKMIINQIDINYEC